MQTNAPEIYEIISRCNNIVLGCHINPDGDAVASVLGLALCLSVMGKEPVVIVEDYNDKYNFIKGKEYIFKGDLNELNPDLFISLDCGSIDRLGDAEDVFKRANETMCIDHHISNTEFADYNIVCPDASSTCEVIYEIVSNFCMLNRDIADAIYAGIIYDTNGFKNTSTSPRTFEISSQLIKFGIDFSGIQTAVLSSHSEKETAVFIKAVSRYTIDNGICCSYLTKDEILNQCGADYQDLDGIVEYLLNFRNVDVSVFVYEREDGSKKISMRSKKIDISNIALKYNGGGHKLAAGANMDSSVSIEDAIKTMVNSIKNELIQ